jgi:hypothetical protein
MGSSGGMTLVMIMTQLRMSLKRSRLGSCKREREGREREGGARTCVCRVGGLQGVSRIGQHLDTGGCNRVLQRVQAGTQR